MEDFHRAGGLLAVLREVARPARPRRAHRHRPAARRLPRRRPDLGPRGHPPARRAAAADAGHRRAARQPRARRRDHQAGRGLARSCCSTAAGPSSSTSIEDLHARIDDPDLDVDADSVLVLRGCGPQGLPGHARGGEHAAAEEAARAGRARHGADLRRPDERHRVRHGRPARRARGRGRRPARRWSAPATRSSSTSPARRLDVDVPDDELAAPRARTRRRPPRFAAPDAAAGSGSTSTTCMQADTGADLDFLVGSSGDAGLPRVALRKC